MRRFPAIVLLIFISSSCTKTGVQTLQHDIYGTWVLKQYSGGLAGGTYTPTGISTFTFQQNNNYSSAYNDSITEKGTFNIAKAGTPNYYFSETLLKLLPSAGGEITYGIVISHDSLFLDQGCCDQFTYTYVKQK